MHKGYPKGYPPFQWKDEVWLMSCWVRSQRIATSGPLRYIARCIVNDAGTDRAQNIATSTQDGWFEEDYETSIFNAGGND
jgi:hypothetical protein